MGVGVVAAGLLLARLLARACLLCAACRLTTPTTPPHPYPNTAGAFRRVEGVGVPLPCRTGCRGPVER